ncbi:PREDICTED: protein NRDE2 homolog [Ipomoea nil]|uniref:protein NRDE2 homolog n=1 Tax=Ipomoea nil TaxID=35883 RepID=UPI000900C3C3|nr:PREDICTED: protein NRDE2 homolog [Ipomoea nil]
MDVARYKLHNTRKTFELTYFWWNHNSIFDPDGDVDAFDSKLRAEGRYWSAKYAAMERHKNLKQTRMFSHARPQLKDSVDFIPLIDEGSGGESVSGATVVEESWEDEIFCKTKEFNKMTRERPHDEKIWLDFADFLQILEKKISILEKATELNPDSEDLLLSLMNAYQSRDSIDGEFSRFKVSEMRKIYANAIQALSGACSKQHRQVCQGAMPVSLDPAIVKLEVGLVDIFMSLCRFEWQAGYKELATALFQAEIEYSLFSPFLLSKNSKRRLLNIFGVAMVLELGKMEHLAGQRG